MCGILGTLPKSDNGIFKKALDNIAHRGPDDYGIFHNNKISLGHRRLSILDLSNEAHQPMNFEDRWSIIFNGEIYNFIELREALKKKGYKFHSDSDTEVVLKSFIEYKEECLNKFNGMWAFAIWDEKKEELFLSRDRFGKKPLFYSFYSKKFIFASEMKAIILFFKNIEISEDFEWCKNNLFLYEATDKCLVKHIKRFPAGHYAVFKNGKLDIKRYWNTLDNLYEVPSNYEDQVDEFRELFFNACKIRMRSDVSIGTALSGGLDSSAIISTLSYISKSVTDEKVSKEWQHAFIATFKGTPLDESFYAKKVVENIGIDATFLEIDPTKHLDKLEYYFYQLEELYLTNPIPMFALYESIHKKGVKVSIDGHGADELLSGYAGSLLIALADVGFNFDGIKSILNAYNDLVDEKQLKYEKIDSKILIYIRSLIKHFLKKYFNLGYKSPQINNDKFEKLDNFNRHLYSQVHEIVLPTLLRNYDRFSMTNSVEIRMPFMDHRVVTYLLSLPWDSKIRNGFTKAILRDSMVGLMPDEVLWRKTKIGFGSPIADWMRNQMKEYMLDTINSKDFKEFDLIDAKQVSNKILQVINDRTSSFVEAESAWNSLVPYIWYKAVIKRKS